MIRALPSKEKERLNANFSEKTNLVSHDFTNLDEARFSAVLLCTHFGFYENVVKYETGLKGRQRYSCNSCKRHFTGVTDTFLIFNEERLVRLALIKSCIWSGGCPSARTASTFFLIVVAVM